MEWIGTTLFWYMMLFLIGFIFTPTARFLFPNAPDRGYPFAKTIGIIALTYGAFISGVLHIAVFSVPTLYALLGLMAIANYFIYTRTKPPTTPLNLKLIIFEEIFFVLSLLALAYMRGQEPSVHGLEKFMDYGFMNSILRSTYFPPADMWYTPLPINYYYFGHMSGAILIKLTSVAWAVGYNLVLATIFAQGMTLAFSLAVMIVSRTEKFIGIKPLTLAKTITFGLLGAALVNVIGNLHTIYLFTKGYPNDHPIEFWKILSWYTPDKYWYPNATRFIPYTIHEFPSYSYVVADLHGHVFDIPFVLLTMALVYTFFMNVKARLLSESADTVVAAPHAKKSKETPKKHHLHPLHLRTYGPYSILFGFMLAVHYMTNAFDGPIYFLMLLAVYFALFKISKRFFGMLAVTGVSFALFSFPFSYFFKPFASGVGVNCAPSFLTQIGKIGPFLFEKGNCQVSPPWMLFILWGFYLIALILFVCVLFRRDEAREDSHFDSIPLIFFGLGFFLIVIPEFFYIKDIYPQHFRANTMFKLGYQAFMMMGIASLYVFYRISTMRSGTKYVLKLVFLTFFALTVIYPLYSVRSYYGKMDKTSQLDGSRWLMDTLPQDGEIITYLNREVTGQPVILEAQGDSYTDYERVSAYTGLPTVAGWWVHEWLWRGDSNVVGERIPDITDIYQSNDLERTRALIKKYKIKFIVVSALEREKYKELNEKKFEQIATKVYTSSNGIGALYQVK